MSKRRGEFITLDELIDEIGVDATRFFMLQRSHDTTVDLDLDLAREQSTENPVYYVQYAHARIASMLRQGGGGAGRRGARERAAGAGGTGTRRSSRPSARWSRSCSRSPTRSPRRPSGARRTAIAAYALELAQDFTAFYRDCHVVGAEPAEVEAFRIALSVAAQRDDRQFAAAARRQRAGLDVSGAASSPAASSRSLSA